MKDNIKNTEPEPEDTELKNKSIPELYELLGKKFSYHGNFIKIITEGIQTKFGLIQQAINAARRLEELENPQEINNIVRRSQEKLIKIMGTKVDVITSTRLKERVETLGDKGILVYTNHQGGGLETFISHYIFGTLTDKPVHWLIKDSLLKIPIFRQVFLSSDFIAITRDPHDFIKNLPKYGEQIADKLKNGRVVIISFEGTRSKDGDINTEHNGLVSRIQKNIDTSIEPGKYLKILMTADTYTVLPKPIESKFGLIWPTKVKAGVNVNLDILDDDIALKPRKNDGGKNIFEVARETLKKMLIAKLSTEEPRA